MNNDEVDVLIVEDNPDDVILMQESLLEAGVNVNLSVVEDGVEAMAFLRREGRYADAPSPDLILLDLNMPKKSGHEVLAEVKADDCLKLIPVVVLTTSRAQEDVVKAYKMHANCFVTKPVDLDAFIRVIHSIDNFWLHIARLPTANRLAYQAGN